MADLGLYWRTIKHLKLVQITNRLKRRFVGKHVSNAPAPNVRHNPQHFAAPIARQQSILDNNHFLFLNQQNSITNPQHWNHPEIGKLWLYNLHYFEGLLNPNTDTNIKQSLIRRWIAENPVASGNGWEPYPNSLRISNWIKWSLTGHPLDQETLDNLAQQIRYLVKTLEFHLLGNHLFANAKALVLAGCYFEGDEAKGWLNKGLAILKTEMSEQFLSDGAHFELSTTYHSLLLEDVLDMINIMRAFDIPYPNQWNHVADQGLKWLAIMTRPDGLPPLFNDAAYGITPRFDQIQAYAHNLGFEVSVYEKSTLTLLDDSGYFRFDGSAYSFIGDAGQPGPTYIPGHAHCDLSSFELFAHARPVIVDTGTSTYEVGERRTIERSTAAHNVVQIADGEQSEIWGGFRLADRAIIVKRETTENSLHLKYQDYQGHNISRDFFFSADDITVKDSVTCDQVATARFHLAPGITPKKTETGFQIGDMRIDFKNALSFDIEDYHYAPEFNKLIPSTVIIVTFQKKLETTIR